MFSQKMAESSYLVSKAFSFKSGNEDSISVLPSAEDEKYNAFISKMKELDVKLKDVLASKDSTAEDFHKLLQQYTASCFNLRGLNAKDSSYQISALKVIDSFPIKVESIIHTMQSSSEISPNSQTYPLALKMLSVAAVCTNNVNSVRHDMTRDYLRQNDSAFDKKHYQFLFQTLEEMCQFHGELEAAKCATKLLKDLEASYLSSPTVGEVETSNEKQQWDGKPSLVMYSSVIRAWKHVADYSNRINHRSPSAWREIDRILTRAQSIYPNHSFDSSIALLLKISAATRRDIEAAKKASECLSRMKKRNLEDNLAVLQAWESCAALQVPNKKDRPALRAWVILQTLQDIFDSTRDSVYLPNTACYKSVMNSLWKDHTANKGTPKKLAVRTNRLLFKMLELHDQGFNEVRPDLDCFTIAMRVLSQQEGNTYKIPHGSYALQFLQRLEMLEELNGSGEFPVSWEHYTFVLKAYDLCLADTEAGSKAEKVLLRLEQRFDTSLEPRLAPRSESYQYAIGAYSQSTSSDKAVKATYIFRHMEERYLEHLDSNLYPKPTTECYNAVLKVCSKPPPRMTSSDRIKMFTSALHATKRLQRSRDVRPSSSTYFWLLKSCENCLEEQAHKDVAAKTIFQQAKKYGCVDQDVVRQLRYASSAATYKELTGTSSVNNRFVIPRIWRRNVKPKLLEARTKPTKKPNLEKIKTGRMRKLLEGGRVTEDEAEDIEEHEERETRQVLE